MSNAWKTYPQDVPDELREITFYSHRILFYFKGIYSGFKKGTGDTVGEVWNGEVIRRMRAGDFWKYGDALPPPATATTFATTPLVEAAAAAATGDDEITGEKLISIFNDIGNGWYEIWITDEKCLSVDLSEAVYALCYEDENTNMCGDVSTMTELRTLIKWLT